MGQEPQLTAGRQHARGLGTQVTSARPSPNWPPAAQAGHHRDVVGAGVSLGRSDSDPIPLPGRAHCSAASRGGAATRLPLPQPFQEARVAPRPSELPAARASAPEADSEFSAP